MWGFGLAPYISYLRGSVSTYSSSAPDLDEAHPDNPKHVAIIMDGNNRWAKQQGLAGVEGHRQGARAVRATVENCAKSGVDHLTVYAFSSENWRRPEQEVEALMRLFLQALAEEVDDLHANGIRLQFIGDLTAFSPELISNMEHAMDLTAHNKAMTFSVAVNYGGHWDIAHACQQVAQSVVDGELTPAQITPALLQQYVQLGQAPLPDLLIRTGGEQRISNFLLWQIAYTELYFTDTYWPDFDDECLQAAFIEYRSRQRRFGRTGAQVEMSQS